MIPEAFVRHVGEEGSSKVPLQIKGLLNDIWVKVMSDVHDEALRLITQYSDTFAATILALKTPACHLCTFSLKEILF